MSRLFVNLYLDEDVSSLIAALVKSRNLVAVTSHQAGQDGTTDQHQLEYAAERRMAILTHNRDDYLDLAARFAKTNRHHCGIIIAIRRPPYALAGIAQ